MEEEEEEEEEEGKVREKDANEELCNVFNLDTILFFL